MRPRISIVIGVVVVLATAAHAEPALRGVEGSEQPPEPADPDAPMYRCAKPKSSGKLVISFKPEVELKELATWAMGFSCKRVVYASGLAARTSKVVMMTPGEVTPREAWRIFQGALAAMGLTTVTKGDTLQIVESASAAGEAIAITKRFPDGGAEVMRLMYRPEHVAVEDLQQALELVKSKNGTVSPLPKLGVLLVTDLASHIARMQTLVRELDRPAAGDGVYAIPVQYTDPAALVETLQKLIEDREGKPATVSASAPGAAGPAGPPRGGPRLVAAPRVRAVFVVGTAAEYLRVRAIATALDIDIGDTARIQAMRLRHANAKEVATTLSTLVSGAGGTTPAVTPSGRPIPPNLLPQQPSTTDAVLAGPVKFAADESSNTLLVMASPRDALAVRSLVDDLDTPRRQIYIEALVLEVEASNTRDVGISAHGGKADGRGDAAIVGSFQSDGLVSADPKSALGTTGLVGGVLGKPLTGMLGDLLGQTIPSFGVLIRAAAHHSRLDVLAQPHVTAIDNKLSTLSVGANIPYKSSRGGVVPTSGLPVEPNIERQKVGLTLAITPHVSSATPTGGGELVRLDVKLDSFLLGKEDYGGLGPSWKERTIDTSVVLRDQESVVLGGLVDERIEDTVDSIPILGDIPLVGRLFRSTKKVRMKSNLLVVLTPHLIDDSIAGREILQRRLREREEFLTSTIDLQQRIAQQHVDYRTRRGLVAEIDAVVRRVDREKEELAAARHRLSPPDGRVDEAAPVPTASPQPSALSGQPAGAD